MKKPSLKKESLVHLLKIATKQVEFRFNKTLFYETDGVAMGSNLDLVLANILIP